MSEKHLSVDADIHLINPEKGLTTEQVKSLERIDECVGERGVLGKDLAVGCEHVEKPKLLHWSKLVKPKPDHEFVNVCGRWVELHVDLIYGVTPYQSLQRKWKAWKENLKIKLIQFLIKLLSISGRQCISFCRTVLVSPFTFIKKVLCYPFTVIPTKSVLENYIKNSRNSKKYGTRNRT